MEINEQNVLIARNKLKKDERVTIHRMDFCDYKQPLSYDFILNMIPCNPIIYPLDEIWEKVLHFSKDQGKIVTLLTTLMANLTTVTMKFIIVVLTLKDTLKKCVIK